MKLYEINEKIGEVLSKAEEETLINGCVSEETAELLENLTVSFDEKADNIACLIKNNLAHSKVLREEAGNLYKRATAKDRSNDFLTNYLFGNMKTLGKTQIETTRNKITVRKNPESVEVDNDFISWAQSNADNLLNYKEPTPNKKAIKEALKSGQSVEHARLVKNERIDIK